MSQRLRAAQHQRAQRSLLVRPDAGRVHSLRGISTGHNTRVCAFERTSAGVARAHLGHDPRPVDSSVRRHFAAADKSTAGEFITEPPTLISLGFEWRIDGDDNRNAQVAVTYRKQGEQAWKSGPPLLRIGNERINENALQYVTPNGFAGSVFDLEPATTYEARFVLSDPDGVEAERSGVVSVRTRAEPMPAAGGKVYHVYPPGYEGQKQEPAFTGLLARVLHRLVAFRQLQHLSASRAARRHDPRPRRRLQGRSPPLRRRARDGVERHLLPHPERHGRSADRDQGRRRRRGRSSTATAPTTCST